MCRIFDFDGFALAPPSMASASPTGSPGVRWRTKTWNLSAARTPAVMTIEWQLLHHHPRHRPAGRDELPARPLLPPRAARTVPRELPEGTGRAGDRGHPASRRIRPTTSMGLGEALRGSQRSPTRTGAYLAAARSYAAMHAQPADRPPYCALRDRDEHRHGHSPMAGTARRRLHIPGQMVTRLKSTDADHCGLARTVTMERQFRLQASFGFRTRRCGRSYRHRYELTTAWNPGPSRVWQMIIHLNRAGPPRVIGRRRPRSCGTFIIEPQHGAYRHHRGFGWS